MTSTYVPSKALLRVFRASLGRSYRSAAPFSQCAKAYHSVHHPEPPPFDKTRDAILSAALKRVPDHGFTDESLGLGAKDAGYLDVTVQLFPRGVMDLVHYHLVTQRHALKERVQFSASDKLSLGAKVRTLTWARLSANSDIIHQWPGALGHMSLIGNVPAALNELHALADEIWYLSGDTAVDFSWYTKRASLAGVYASSEMFMTTDSSTDFSATQDFLERRLKDVQVLGGSVGGVAEYVGFWALNSVNVARSWGMKV